MDRRLGRTLATAGIVALLLLVGAIGLFPGAHAAPAARPSAPHPAASSVTVTPFACWPFPYPNHVFNTSLLGGRVCFYVTDASDTSATVTVLDQNATRDGLSTPAATFTVNTTTGVNASYPNTFYQIPHGLAHGGYWNLSVHGANGGVSNATFFVHTYGVLLNPNAAVYLPGHPAQVNYQIFSTANDAPFSNVTSVRATATYQDAQGVLTSIFPGAISLNVTSEGVISITMPTNIPTFHAVFVTLWANQTAPQVNISESATTALQVGQLAVPVLHLQDAGCSGLCFTTVLRAGEPAILTVQAVVAGTSGATAPAAGLSAHFQFRAKGANLSGVPGSPPLAGTLNSSGQLSIVFLANASVFSVAAFNEVIANVSDPATSMTAGAGYLNFTVLPPLLGEALLGISVSATAYYGGDTLSATWSIGAVTPSALAGWQVDHWVVADAINGGILATGLVTTTATAGTFTYAIPVRYTGVLSVNVYAHNQTSNLVATQNVAVTAPDILLSPSETSFLPGDTVTFTVTPLGNVLAGATYFGSVRDDRGNSYFDGILSGSSLAVAIPKAAPPTQIQVLVTAQTATWGVIASATTTVSERSGLALSASIGTASQYTDGSFTPGQTIQIHYQLSLVGSAVPPKYYWIYVYPTFFGFGSGGGVLAFSTTSPSGTVSYTLPGNLPSGFQMLEVYAVMGGGCSIPPYPCSSAASYVGLQLNSNPSFLDYELGAGSGVTVAWLILLVLIVVVAFFVWRVGRSRRGRAPPTPLAPASPTVPPISMSSSPPPAGPPSEGPPAGSPAWSENPATSETPPGSPPLPSPGNPPPSA